MSDPDDHRWLARAVELAVANVRDGGGPFGAVVVREGETLAEGVNRVALDLDPTAHAEVMAIRAACRAVGDFSLTGATLYASCEPCPLCLSAALWARIPRVVYAADRADAARAGFDDDRFHRLFISPREDWPVSLEHAPVDDRAEPFEAWQAHEDHTPY